jgi:hypothetical protein
MPIIVIGSIKTCVTIREISNEVDSPEGGATFRALKLPLDREWWRASASTTAIFLLFFSAVLAHLLLFLFDLLLFTLMDRLHLSHLLSYYD